MEKMKMESANITDMNIDKIAALFPNCITETADENGKLKKAVNFDMLRAMLSEDIAEGDEAYEFTWVGKKAAIAEANRSIRKTLRPCHEESVNWDTTENLYIEGDNLEVLKLLQESYLGKVKMIYIDPPYNTGNDFIYRDDFAVSADDYAEESGQLDEDGNRLFKNTDSNGRFHSDWCSMIYSRLMLARNLLAEDGVIFISIDDCEIENLIRICNETFGEDNILANLIWDLGTGTTAGHFTRGHEYILCYAKNKSILQNFKNFNEGERIKHGALKKISIKNPAGEIVFPIGFEYDGTDAVFSGELGDSEKEYILSDEMRFENGKLVAETRIKAGFAMKKQVEDYIAGKEVFDTKGQKVLRFYFNSSGILFYEKEKSVINPRTVISGLANTKNGSSELISLFGEKYFDYPKPSSLTKFLIQLITGKDSVIPLNVEKEYNRMLRREKYLEERDAAYLNQSADFDDVLEINPDPASIPISEFEAEEIRKHNRRLDYLPDAMEMLRTEYPEGYDLISEYYLGDDKVTLFYLMEKYGLTRPMVKYRMKAAKEKLKFYIILHETED